MTVYDDEPEVLERAGDPGCPNAPHFWWGSCPCGYRHRTLQPEPDPGLPRPLPRYMP